MFFQRRKGTADQLREDEARWRVERRQRRQELNAWAGNNRKCAYETRKGAADAVEHFHLHNRGTTLAMRDSIHHVENRKVKLYLQNAASNKQSHDEKFRSKYVSQEEAARMTESEYNMLANKHRENPIVVSNPAGRGPWKPYF